MHTKSVRIVIYFYIPDRELQETDETDLLFISVNGECNDYDQD